MAKADRTTRIRRERRLRLCTGLPAPFCSPISSTPTWAAAAHCQARLKLASSFELFLAHTPCNAARILLSNFSPVCVSTPLIPSIAHQPSTRALHCTRSQAFGIQPSPPMRKKIYGVSTRHLRDSANTPSAPPSTAPTHGCHSERIQCLLNSSYVPVRLETCRARHVLSCIYPPPIAAYPSLVWEPAANN
ncbi:hypothetical protein FA95DRAFT_787382 [Auriscalpium vulgare]|uniref:Uncharacterized protein n=1 Tax=Auriscalpium vulgare TaxID=40419 RepID=A0ACB8RBD9_9AGAM|nr:hypothetical protein FA95DRAFT_787382 [Auriscalpium vulgare]